MSRAGAAHGTGQGWKAIAGGSRSHPWGFTLFCVIVRSEKGNISTEPQDGPTSMLLTFLSTNHARIVEALYERICQATQPEAQFAPHVLRDNIVKGAAAFVAALQADDPTVLDRFIADLIAPRTVEEFPLAVLHRAFTVFGEMLVPLLRECYGDDTVRILDELQRLHLLIDAILHRLVTHYETRSKVLVRRQQEQLPAYSQQLEA